MSGRGRGSGAGDKGQWYTNAAPGRGRGGRGRGRGNAGRGGGRGDGGRGGGRGYGGRGRGRSPGSYNAPQLESDYQSLAPSVSSLTRDVATVVNIQCSGSTSASSPQPSSSASTPPQLQEVESSVQKHIPPPASSKAMRLPARPGLGEVGEKCTVRANHFHVPFDVNKDIHHYDVTITPEIGSKKICREIIKRIVDNFKQSHLGNRILAYDGRRSAYTAGPLPFTSAEFVVALSTGARRQREFQVSVRFAAKPGLHHLLEFLNRNQVDAPQETIQALDVVFRHTPSANYITVGRSFFGPNLGTRGALGEGLEYWKGFYQSLRPTQMGLSLNIDISARPFYEPILVTDFITKSLNITNFRRRLPDNDFAKVKRDLQGIIVETNHLGYVKRQKVSWFTRALLRELSFPVDETGANISVMEYFHQRYKITLQYEYWPAFQYGTKSKPLYLPMELCTIAPNQRYTRKLSSKQTIALLEATCESPVVRSKHIEEMVSENNYNTDIFGNEFGVQVRPDLTSVSARVLPRPTLRYKDEDGKTFLFDPREEEWSMTGKKFDIGGKVDFWTCINFSKTRNDPDIPRNFCSHLLNICRMRGMVFSPSFLPFQTGDPNQIKQSLLRIHDQSIAKFKKLGLDGGRRIRLLIVILPDKSGAYGTIKRVCETELGIVSQCCRLEKVLEAESKYLENVALKINVKVGGRNAVLDKAVQKSIPFLTDVPTIIFGADVTHPSPGKDATPSIAAVVGSMDWPECTKYKGLVSAQRQGQEIIQDLYKKIEDPKKGVVHAGMIRELLWSFYCSTSQKPLRIIFYRDGVSEGQFNQVLIQEIDAIRKACVSLGKDYEPPVTFIVVQKRHHTRLFPATNHSDPPMTDESGNILPGTVVDTKICHPREFDFFLCSHAGIKGTSRPAHYHVLLDENNFSADELQTLTNNLCYTYARCTRSVSIVPPAYYAHLTASRARYYMESEAREGNVEIRALPEIKENVKNVMFYC